MKKNLIFIGLTLIVEPLRGGLMFGRSGIDEQAVKGLFGMSDSNDH